ncbi:hypothetical protein N7510_002622 [Penicillium lagena]|uniref:uncharacterized protein n=1 Tax=Penicillium lagena TaxID=94218 RepID=UPI0025419C9F|nr:uncharacterized protein N7510_002622 [Penicillium lagena]KAJ5626313.1 hypothetical protein N7510_002622 [Penicillium lagena]
MSPAHIERPLSIVSHTRASLSIPKKSELESGHDEDEEQQVAATKERGRFPQMESLKQLPDDLQQASVIDFETTNERRTIHGRDLNINPTNEPSFLDFLKIGSHHLRNFSKRGNSQPPVTNLTPKPIKKASQLIEHSDRMSDVPLSETPPPGAPQASSKSILRRHNDLNIDSIVWDDSSRDGRNMQRLIDLDDAISRLLQAGKSKPTKRLCLTNTEIMSICSATRNLFLSQPILLELNAPIHIVGDIHGQFTDLLRIFEISGLPSTTNYLFLGDYVDRGRLSLETILLLLCYKLKYPETFFLLRGNHECANISRIYGFYDECKRRCNIKIWKTFIDVFNCLPIAAVVAEKIFCVHGGLSPCLSDMNDIRNLARPTEVPGQGLLTDLLWSDPANIKDWGPNGDRGVSWVFGRKVVANFLKRYDLDLVCRAHMVVEGGYEFFGERNLVTVFSAPNYCGEFDNWGAIMSVSDDLLCNFDVLKPSDSVTFGKKMKKRS